MASRSAQHWIAKLGMLPHPEGGYYKEVYRSREDDKVSVGWSEDQRDVATGIYFLLQSSDISAFHRIKSDEIWHFYDGSPVTIYEIDEDGDVVTNTVGISEGYMPQHVVRADRWFAAEVKDQDSYVLVGCTVSPGFDFRDFELADKGALIEEYPLHEELISRFTS